MLAVIRASALEPLFGGLDRGVKLHRSLGLFALMLLGIHVFCIAVGAIREGASHGDMLMPFWSPKARSADILVFFALAVLGVLAYDTRLRYETWVFLHRFIGLLLYPHSGRRARTRRLVRNRQTHNSVHPESNRPTQLTRSSNAAV
jgi:predicted ferric reductase